ncbi:MAG: esterase family protein [Acidobacteriota bacterium]|nr:esterase family protein [Acidobacteriota bacterium]
MISTKKRFFGQILLVLAIASSFAIDAQERSDKTSKNIAASILNTNAQDLKLKSKLMARQMPYRVVLPVNYGNSDETTFYPVIYLLHGLTGHFDDWADKTKLKDYAKNYNYIIVMPEGNNGWYTDSATVASDKYESYIIRELIPEIEKKFRAKTTRDSRAVAGLSMGGYGAIKFGLKYPEMFALVGSFSGALGAGTWTEKTLGANGGAIAVSILSVFGIENSQTRQTNDIFKIAREMSPEKIKSLPFIYQDCGTEDFLYQNNRDFVALLQEKRIPHEFRELPGNHNWIFWNTQIKQFLELSENFLVSDNKKLEPGINQEFINSLPTKKTKQHK